MHVDTVQAFVSVQDKETADAGSCMLARSRAIASHPKV